MRKDPVERQTRKLIGRIPPVLEHASRPLSIQQIARGMGYYTNAPWCVMFAVRQLERHGVIQRDRSRGNRAPWKWQLTNPPAGVGR